MQYKGKEINRIRIIGGAGSGKTTLAKRLEDILEIPLISLDHITKKVKAMPNESR
jgi:adenylate kinase family enzyme